MANYYEINSPVMACKRIANKMGTVNFHSGKKIAAFVKSKLFITTISPKKSRIKYRAAPDILSGLVIAITCPPLNF
jgi:serine protease inhibitor ecotin